MSPVDYDPSKEVGIFDLACPNWASHFGHLPAEKFPHYEAASELDLLLASVTYL